MAYVRKAVGFFAGRSSRDGLLGGSRVPHQPAQNFEDLMHLLENFCSSLREALESLQVNLAWNPLAASRVAASKLGRPARKF